MSKNTLIIVLVIGAAVVGIYLFLTRKQPGQTYPGVPGTGIRGTTPNVINDPTALAVATGANSLENLFSIFDTPLTSRTAPSTIVAATGPAGTSQLSAAELASETQANVSAQGFTTADFTDYTSLEPPPDASSSGQNDLIAATTVPDLGIYD